MRSSHVGEQRKFDHAFREGAVRIVRETGIPIAQVPRDLGINETRWATGMPRIVPKGRAPAAYP